MPLRCMLLAATLASTSPSHAEDNHLSSFTPTPQPWKTPNNFHQEARHPLTTQYPDLPHEDIHSLQAKVPKNPNLKKIGQAPWRRRLEEKQPANWQVPSKQTKAKTPTIPKNSTEGKMQTWLTESQKNILKKIEYLRGLIRARVT